MKQVIMIVTLMVALVSGLDTRAETGGTAPASQSTLVGKPVDINTASREQLVALPGIGEAKADAIIEQRVKQPYTRVEDLLIVKGIGEKMLEKIAPLVAVNGEQPVKTVTK